MYGYQLKFGRNEHSENGVYNPHPPDDKILAQICSVLSPIELENLLSELRAESKQPGYSYSWYITVAAQRRFGIPPQALKERRAQLRVERYRGTALAGEQQQLGGLTEEQTTVDPEFAREVIDSLNQRVRKLR